MEGSEGLRLERAQGGDAFPGGAVPVQHRRAVSHGPGIRGRQHAHGIEGELKVGDRASIGLRTSGRRRGRPERHDQGRTDGGAGENPDRPARRRAGPRLTARVVVAWDAASRRTWRGLRLVGAAHIVEYGLALLIDKAGEQLLRIPEN